MYFENSSGWIYIKNGIVTAVSPSGVLHFDSNYSLDLNRFFYDFIEQLTIYEARREHQ